MINPIYYKTKSSTNQGQTHWEDCWADGPAHYACLLERANKFQADLHELLNSYNPLQIRRAVPYDYGPEEENYINPAREADLRRQRDTAQRPAPAPAFPFEVDSDGCYTLPDGSCISPGPCIHTPPTREQLRPERTTQELSPVPCNLKLPQQDTTAGWDTAEHFRRLMYERQRDCEAVTRERDELKAEIARLKDELRLVTSPHESVGSVLAALKAERDRLANALAVCGVVARGRRQAYPPEHGSDTLKAIEVLLAERDEARARLAELEPLVAKVVRWHRDRSDAHLSSSPLPWHALVLHERRRAAKERSDGK